MTRPNRYPQELRERAVRMVIEHRGEHPSEWATMCSIASKFGMTAETLSPEFVMISCWLPLRSRSDWGRVQFVGQERRGLSALERRAVRVSMWQDLTQGI